MEYLQTLLAEVATFQKDRNETSLYRRGDHITSFLGEDVILPCKFSFPKGTPVGYVVEWGNDDVKLPIYIWYDGYPPHVGEGYEGRVSINGLASLNLTGVKESDGGWYECKVYFLNRPPDSWKSDFWIHLNVLGGINETATSMPVSPEVLMGSDLYDEQNDSLSNSTSGGINETATSMPVSPEVLMGSDLYDEQNDSLSNSTSGGINETTTYMLVSPEVLMGSDLYDEQNDSLSNSTSGLLTEILVADNLTTVFETHEFSSETTTAFTTQNMPPTASKVEPANLENVSSSKTLQDKGIKAIYLSSKAESSTASLLSSKNETSRTTNKISTTSEPSNQEIKKEYVASDSEPEIIAVSPVNIKPEISEESNEIKKTLSAIVTSTDNVVVDNAVNNEIVESGTSPDVSNIKDGITTYPTVHLVDQNAESNELNSIESSTTIPDKENSLHSAVKRDLVAKLAEKNITKTDPVNFANVDNDNNSSVSTTISSQQMENSKVPGLVFGDSFSSESISSTLMSIINKESTQSSKISPTSATEINTKNDSQLFEASQTTATSNSPSTELAAKVVTLVMQTDDNGTSTTSKSVDVTKNEEATTIKVSSQDSTPYFNHDHSQMKPLVKSRGQRSSVSKSELVKDNAEGISLETHDSTSSSSERSVSNASSRSEPISTTKPTVDTHTSIQEESTKFYNISEDVSLLDEKYLTNSNAAAEHSSEDTGSTIRVQDMENSKVPSNKDASAPIDVSVDDSIHEAESSIIVVTTHNNSNRVPQHHQDELSKAKENMSHFIVTESKLKNNVSSEDTLQNEGNSTETELLIDSKLSGIVHSVPENKVTVDSPMLINASTFRVLEKGQHELVSLEEFLNSTSKPILLEEKMMNDAPQPEDIHSVASNKDASSKEEHNIHDLNSVQHNPKEKGDPETNSLVSQSLNAPTPEPTSKAAKESSAVQSIVIQPTISGEKLVTVIDTRIIGSTSQVSTSPVVEEKISAHPTESEVSLQVLTSAVDNSNSSSTDKHLNGDLVIRDQITQTESKNIHNGSENILPNVSQTSNEYVAKTAVSSGPQIRKENFNTTDISTVAFQPAQSNETTTNDTNSTNSELATSTPIVETTTVVVPAPTLIPKPKIRFIGDRTATRAPITRSKPKRPSPEDVGTVVSIFRKSRTRRPSITSSTTYGPPVKYSFNKDRPPAIVGTETIMFLLPETTTPVTTTEAEEVEEEEEDTEEENIVGETISLNEPIFEEAGELIKVAAELVVQKGLRWRETLNNRDSPEFKKQSERMLRTLQQMFQDTSLSDHMHSIEIDGFVRRPKGKGSRSVIVDYSIYLQKSAEPVDRTQVISIFNDKLINNTFGRYIFDPSLNKVVDVKAFVKIRPTEAPEDIEPPIPQWAIAVIVIGAASFIFIVLFAAVTAYGRHHMRRRYANKLNDDDIERSDDSREWENRLGTSAYENLAADGIYDGMDDSVANNRADMKRPKYMPPNPPRNPRMRHYDSWRTEWTEAPKRMRHPVNHIVF